MKTHKATINPHSMFIKPKVFPLCGEQSLEGAVPMSDSWRDVDCLRCLRKGNRPAYLKANASKRPGGCP